MDFARQSERPDVVWRKASHRVEGGQSRRSIPERAQRACAFPKEHHAFFVVFDVGKPRVDEATVTRDEYRLRAPDGTTG